MTTQLESCIRHLIFLVSFICSFQGWALCYCLYFYCVFCVLIPMTLLHAYVLFMILETVNFIFFPADPLMVSYLEQMLMVKLSFHIKLGCSLLSDWLQLLHEYYQDLLSCPISQLEIGQNNTLEGSPFLLCLEDQDVYHLASGHLQRKAVFLFLRCSLSLISIRNNDDVKCTCAWPTSSIDSTLVMAKDCFAEKKGLLQFHEWVQVQVHTPSNMCLENEIDLEKCIKFASSFIRFYMQEVYSFVDYL